MKLIKAIAYLTMIVSMSYSAHAQQNTLGVIQCGAEIESEIVNADVQPYQDFGLATPAGTRINLSIKPFGGFNPFVFILDSGNEEMIRLNSTRGGEIEELIDYEISSSNPTVRILGAPPDSVSLVESRSSDTFQKYLDYDMSHGGDYGRGGYLGGVGKYSGTYILSVGCTLRDGTVINPGDTAQPVQPPTDGGNNPPPAFSGVGFPGLAPVDFSAVAKIPMIANVPMTGAVAPDGNVILGYTVDAAANDTLALSFTRLSGNLNLGLVVLSADNKVVFQASLVTSSELTTKFTLPSAGQYTIGVFRIDLLPPAAPEPTAFQLQATLNP